MAKIKVYRKDTGAIVRVPAHFLDHPLLADPFRKTPSQKTKELEEQAQTEVAALEALHQTPASRADESANPKSTRQSANAGDDKKE
jgi:hypothetical protein